MEPKIRAHVFVEGKVQGVFFRYWTKQNADELGLVGWVKNLNDGTVEAMFEGEKSVIEEMIRRCRVGSKESEVEHVDATYEKATGEFKMFSIF